MQSERLDNIITHEYSFSNNFKTHQFPKVKKFHNEYYGYFLKQLDFLKSEDNTDQTLDSIFRIIDKTGV